MEGAGSVRTSSNEIVIGSRFVTSVVMTDLLPEGRLPFSRICMSFILSSGQFNHLVTIVIRRDTRSHDAEGPEIRGI